MHDVELGQHVALDRLLCHLAEVCVRSPDAEVYTRLRRLEKCAMTSGHEKSIHRLAERKGFRLDKVGKGNHRFYIVDLASGGRMPSGVPEHEYSFSLEQVEEWLASRDGPKDR